jgi:hypothetical protein
LKNGVLKEENILGIYRKMKVFLSSKLRGRIPGKFISDLPSMQITVDIFKNEWASKLPLPNVHSGTNELFRDIRIEWFLKEVGGLKNKRILELGPLEGGHSYMLEKHGVVEVVAIEANVHAYLKCLVVKELFNLHKVQFKCGDIIKYLDALESGFDSVIACGVLYHLVDPYRLFQLLAKRCSGPIFLWTHYWSDKGTDPQWQKRFSRVRRVTIGKNVDIELHRHEYGMTFIRKNFWGGNAPYSEWMTREGLLKCIEIYGFTVKSIAFDEPEHANGPAIAMILIPKER